MVGTMLGTKLAETAGLTAGVAVTIALRLSRKWNEPIIDQGEPAQHIPGADRIGDHALRKRHQPVVGPLISARAEQMPNGVLQNLVASFGAGATDAPGTSYRLESALEDRLKALALRVGPR